MNKKILILGIMLIAGFSFAASPHFPMPNPALEAKMDRAYCMIMTQLYPMNASAFAYNSSYNSQFGAVITTSLVASYGRLLDYGCLDNNAASFNSEFSGTFMPLVNQVRALYFRAAFDGVRSNTPPGTTFATVLAQYGGFQNNMQSCLNSPSPGYCSPS